MDEHELKAYVERKLRVKIPADVWEALKGDGYVGDVLADELSPDELLVDRAQRYCQLYRTQPKDSGHSPTGATAESAEVDQAQEDIASRLEDYERKRSEAYSAYLAKAAAGNKRVRRFRQRHLRHGLLAQEKEDIENRSSKFKEDLREVGGYLTRHYPWSEDEAVHFVLTDDLPEVVPLYGSIKLLGSELHLFSYGSITLTVEPWVSAESVERFYREMQSWMLGGKPREGERRNLVVFQFVIERCKSVEWLTVQAQDEKLGKFKARDRGLVGNPPWRELLRLWNERYPKGHEWHYKEVRNFQRDFNRAASAVLFPVTSDVYNALSPNQEQSQQPAV